MSYCSLGMGLPPAARRTDGRINWPVFAAGTLGPEPNPPEGVAADPAAVDTESDPAYGHVVRHGTRTSYEYPNRRADALRASATAEAGYTRDARSQPCNGAHRRESGARATTAALEQRPAVTREAAGGIPGSAPVGWTERERLAFLRRVQHVDPRERRA